MATNPTQLSLIGGRTPPPRRLMCVDPGSPDVGVALFDHGVLARAEWVKIPRPEASVCPPCRTKGRASCRHLAGPRTMVALCDAIEDKLGTRDLEHGHPLLPDVVVFEEPQKFRTTPGAGAHTSKLERVVCALGDRAAGWGAAVYFYWPAELGRGGRDKPTHQTLVLGRLSDTERDLLPRTSDGPDWRYRSDPLDAVAVGVWWLEQTGGRPYALRRGYQSLRHRVEEKKT